MNKENARLIKLICTGKFLGTDVIITVERANPPEEKLKWDEAFISSPRSERCLCIPFSDRLNELYERHLKYEAILDDLIAKHKGG